MLNLAGKPVVNVAPRSRIGRRGRGR